MTLGDLRDRLDGNELDLSMDSLSVVPVKELAALPRATHIDLSCNLLTTIPEQFCALTHLVKLDLSKNQLTSLPAEFGALQRLQYIDLFNNKLSTVPVSMYKLKNLKYLDLKANPLNETLMKVAGNCMDDTECKNCAKRVLSFLRDVNSEQERRRQKELQKQRELESARRLEEEKEAQKERERIKAEKAALKQKRRQEYEARQAKQRQENQTAQRIEEAPPKTNGVDTASKTEHRTRGLPCLSLCVSLAVVLLAVLIGLIYFCQHNTDLVQCRELTHHLQTVTTTVDAYCRRALNLTQQYLHTAGREIESFTQNLRRKLS